MSGSPQQISESNASGRGRGRGRGRSRGGLGKYLRARGRGGGPGRPAVFNERLLLEGEGGVEEEEEEAAERALKYSKRRLGTNADRYDEPEPELGSDGEPIIEPEVDLSSFLERQRLSETGPSQAPPSEDEDDVDTTLAHITTRTQTLNTSRKGKVKQVEWDKELDDLSREKASAEAAWELKSRFRTKAERLRVKPPSDSHRKAGSTYGEAPALPLPDGSTSPPKSTREEMQVFLDELLS